MARNTEEWYEMNPTAATYAYMGASVAMAELMGVVDFDSPARIAYELLGQARDAFLAGARYAYTHETRLPKPDAMDDAIVESIESLLY